MNTALFFEIIGYIASGLVALSLTMTSILKLRVINSIGAAVFVIYGILIGAYPIVVVNGFIFIINIYYLYQINNRTEYFTLLEISPNSEYLSHFLKTNQTMIEEYCPNFEFDANRPQTAVLILRDTVAAGVFMGEKVNDETMNVIVDFAIPGYRDFKLGHYLYTQRKAFFIEKGITELISQVGNQKHHNYLTRMGFAKNEQTQTYQLSLK